MIIGTVTLITIFLFGGGGGLSLVSATQEMRERVNEVFQDEAQAAKVRATLDAAAAEYGTFAQDLETTRQRVRRLDGGHDTLTRDYGRAFEELEKVWREREARLLELRSQLKGEMTREQWDALHEELVKKLDKMEEKRAS